MIFSLQGHEFKLGVFFLDRELLFRSWLRSSPWPTLCCEIVSDRRLTNFVFVPRWQHTVLFAAFQIETQVSLDRVFVRSA